MAWVEGKSKEPGAILGPSWGAGIALALRNCQNQPGQGFFNVTVRWSSTCAPATTPATCASTKVKKRVSLLAGNHFTCSGSLNMKHVIVCSHVNLQQLPTSGRVFKNCHPLQCHPYSHPTFLGQVWHSCKLLGSRASSSPNKPEKKTPLVGSQ